LWLIIGIDNRLVHRLRILELGRKGNIRNKR
jgi:hypothetical protein